MGGVAQRGALLSCTTKSALRRACAAEQVVRVGHGVYALPAANDAKVAAARVRGTVSHLSAALAHGWKVKRPPRRPAVTVARNRLVGDAGLEVHYADLRPDEVRGRLTSPVRTVIDCARSLPYDEALCVADSALRSRMVSRTELEAAALASPRTGRKKALCVVRAATPKAANPFESALRAIGKTVPGLAVVPQGEVGAIGHADLTDARLGIAIEADSFEFHAVRGAFDYDIRRYTAMTRTGWLVVRFTWDDVMHRPDYVRVVLADVVALRTGE